MADKQTWEERVWAIIEAESDISSDLSTAADYKAARALLDREVPALLSDLKALEQRAEEAEAEVVRLREALVVAEGELKAADDRSGITNLRDQWDSQRDALEAEALEEISRPDVLVNENGKAFGLYAYRRCVSVARHALAQQGEEEGA